MTGPATPGQEGPSFAPPPLPEGWIAQWDGMSRKYYFVQLSTGTSQWETPTRAAPTGPTPQATPQAVEHPYGTPREQGDMSGEIVANSDGSKSIRYADGRVEPLGADGERSLGSFAMQQLLGGKKQNQGGLGQLASQFLSSGSSHINQSSGGGSAASGIVGALAGQLLGVGKKQDQQSYAGPQNTQQQSQGGLLGNLSGLFSGHTGSSSGSQGGSFGYSSQNYQQGGYTGSAPPTSYQPSGTGHNPYNPPLPPQSHPYANQINHPPQGYGTPEHSYGQSPNPQQPPYGTPSSQQTPYGAPLSQQPPYSGASQSQPPSYGSQQPPSQQQSPYGGATSSQQSPYGSSSQQQPPYGGATSSQQSPYGSSSQQQPPYGGAQRPQYSPSYGGNQHQPSYGSGQPPSQSQQYPPPPPPPSYDQGGYGAPPNPQPGHYAEMSGGLYGGSGAPSLPMGSHPHHGHQYQSQPPGPPPGQGYGAPPGGHGSQQGRW